MPILRTLGLSLPVVLFLVLAACGGGGNKTTHTVSGQFQKGPFAIGSQISVNELDESLNPIGKVYNVQTSDNLGHFTVGSALGSQLIEIVGSGIYMDEVTGGLSSSQVQIRAVVDLNIDPTPTVNILTELQLLRLKKLITQGMTYAAANNQSRNEVLAAFGIDPAKVVGLTTLYSMKIDGSSDADAVLLAVSSILSKMAANAATANSTTQPVELASYLSTIASQISAGGTITSANIKTAMSLAATQIDLVAVRANIETYYSNYGVAMVAPKFEEWVDKDASGILPRRLVPVTGLSFINTTGVEPNQLITSSTITVSGLGAGVVAPVAVNAGTTIIKNGAAVTGTSSTAVDGDTIALRITSLGYGHVNYSTISVGSTSATWNVTTKLLSGTISGLTSPGLVLQNNGGDNITIEANATSFSFPTPLANGAGYSISVLTQPLPITQACNVSNGSGIVGNALSNINVTCSSITEMALVLAYSSSTSPNNISTYAIDPNTGTLNFIPGSQVATGANLYPGAKTISPDGKFAYMTNNNGVNDSISGYSVNHTTGVLSNIVGSPFATGPYPYSIAVDPNNKFVYVGGAGATVSAYAINSTTGALTPIAGSPYAVPITSGNTSFLARSIKIDPSGKFAYIAVCSWGYNALGGLAAYTIDQTTGVLTGIAGSPFATGTCMYSVDIDPTGRFLYAPNLMANNVSAFNINATNGALTPIVGSPFLAGWAPISITVDPAGKFAYVANSAITLSYTAGYSFHSISTYAIDATSGVLSPIMGSPFSTQAEQPFSVTINNAGKFAYVDANGRYLTYAIDPNTGALTLSTIGNINVNGAIMITHVP